MEGIKVLTGIVGGLGSSKTLFMTKLLIDEYNNGNKIFANYNIKGIETFPLDIEALLKGDEELNNVAIGVDELHIFFDSRVSGGTRNRLISYFILQTRKRNVQFYFTTQNIGQVDKRLRENLHRLVVCHRTGEDIDKDGKEDFFKLDIIDLTRTPARVKGYGFYGAPYFKFFDTNEIIKPI